MDILVDDNSGMVEVQITTNTDCASIFLVQT